MSSVIDSGPDQGVGPTCFVVMPIGETGSQRFDQLRAIYEELFRDVLVGAGFTVARADDVEESGNISAGIVEAIATSDLVIADLTDLNPNVFYELGVRHALVKNGTIMVARKELVNDKSIPFDLSSYRVLPYTAELKGIRAFKESLESFVRSFRAAASDRRDNPVHDTFAELPRSVLAAARSDPESGIRQELADITAKVREYEARYPSVGEVAVSSPWEAVMAIKTQTAAGRLPASLAAQAISAARAPDQERYLECVEAVVGGDGSGLDANDFRQLAGAAKLLDLAPVALAVLDFGVRCLPDDRPLEEDYLTELCHSPGKDDRLRAVATLANRVGIEFASDDQVIVPATLPRRGFRNVGLMLDALHENNDNDRALALASALAEAFPNDGRALRNHGRALEQAGQPAQGLEEYRKALGAPNVESTTPRWLGNTMQNEGRFADAVESYLVTCLLDLDGSVGYQLAVRAALTGLYKEATGEYRGDRRLTGLVDEDQIACLINCFHDCSDRTVGETVQLLGGRDSARALGLERVTHLLDLIALEGTGQGERDVEFVPLEARRTVCADLYGGLRSSLTEAFRLEPAGQPTGGSPDPGTESESVT